MLATLLGFQVIDGLVGRMTYPAPRFEVPSPPPSPLEEAPLILGDGTRISAWFFSAADARMGLIFFHGNGENLGTMLHVNLFERLQELQVSFLAVDYPGYGNSQGTPSEKTLLETAQKCVDWMHQESPDRKIVVCGWSLGAAVAIQTAAANPDRVNGVIALSAWTSLPAVAAEHYPGFLVRWLLDEKYDSISAAQDIKLPVLLIHGIQDRVIPISHGRRLAMGFPTSPRWLEIPQADHSTLLAFDQVWKEIDDFIRMVHTKTIE